MVKRIEKTAAYEIIRHKRSIITELMEGNNEAYLKIGYLDNPDNAVEALGNAPKKTIDHSTGKRRDRRTVAEIAYILEEGWGPIAPRPFMRRALIQGRAELYRYWAAELRKESKKPNFSIKKVLGKVGRKAVKMVQDKIENGRFVALKDPTRKGTFPAGDAPILRDTYELYNSVGYEKVVS